MKWWEVNDDLGDGTSCQRRFRTKEEAQAWRDKMEDDEGFQQDGDGSPVTPVDTNDRWFFHVEDKN